MNTTPAVKIRVIYQYIHGLICFLQHYYNPVIQTMTFAIAASEKKTKHPQKWSSNIPNNAAETGAGYFLPRW